LLRRSRFVPLAACASRAGRRCVGRDDERRLRTGRRRTGIELQLSPTLSPLPRGEPARKLPIIVQARELRGRPDLETVAEGDASFAAAAW
jgi:hypothetical protein